MDAKSRDVVDDAEIIINPRLLNRELTCPICLDILNQTMTTRECLHRFCSGCINKALRSGNKECPTCRKKLTSRRCLRPDPNFDQLISKLYIGENEKVEERNIIIPECEMILRPLAGQEARFIKCPHTATVNHVREYLAMRPKMFKVPDMNTTRTYNICIVADSLRGSYELLSGNMKLHEIKDEFKLESERPLELYFYDPTILTDRRG